MKLAVTGSATGEMPVRGSRYGYGARTGPSLRTLTDVRPVGSSTGTPVSEFA